MQTGNKSSLCKSSLDTLAHNGTKKIIKARPDLKRMIYGEGSDLSNNEALQKKSQRKMITQKIVLNMIDLAKKKRNTKLLKTLWNTYYCQQEVTTSSNRLYTRYCKNRLCSVCAGIRKAEKMRRYLPVIRSWAKPQFVTLTAKAVPAKSLHRRMRDMNRGLQIIIQRIRKQALRGKSTRLVGFKSLECNFNPKKRTYNPHLHLIVENEQMAKIIIKEWLALCTIKFANPKAQLCLPVKDSEKSLVEVIKYATKQFTEPDPEKKSKTSTRYVFTSAIYNIMEAMDGIHVFDRFGFDLPKSSRKESKSMAAQDCESWTYTPSLNDWLNSKNRRLADYLPSAELIATLANNINSELE